MWTDLSEDIAMGSQILVGSRRTDHSHDHDGIRLDDRVADIPSVAFAARRSRPGRPQVFGDLGGRRSPPFDWRRSQRHSQLRNPARSRTRHRAARAITNNGYVPKPIATVPADVEYVQSFHTEKTRPTTCVFPEITLQGAGTHRASGRQAQADRATMRETARNYASFVALVLGLILIKSVHTA